MSNGDDSARPSTSSGNTVEGPYHDSESSFNHIGAVSHVTQQEEHYAKPFDDAKSCFVKGDDENDGVPVSNTICLPATPYVNVNEERPSSRNIMENEGLDEGHESETVPSEFTGDTDDGHESTVPMLTGVSYEELQASLSKFSGEGHGTTGKVRPCMNLLDDSNRSFTSPRSDTGFFRAYDASTSSISRLIPPRRGSYGIDSNGYPTSATAQYSEQHSAGTYKSSHLRSGSITKSDLGSNGSSSRSGRLGPTDGGKEAEASYDITSYATQAGAEYDFNSHSDVSFAAFERRDLENDITLPIANISRVMKSVLPGSAKIAKQAKDIVRDCVTEFIMFVSSEASDICANERRKTLSAEDILLAMNSLGFERYNEALRSYHTRWRERDHPSMMEQ